MNIFYLDEDPREAARMQCDKHVVKMVLESAQLLCTAHRVLDGNQTIRVSDKGRKNKYWEHPNPTMEYSLYKATHVNHPSNVWIRESRSNYYWLLQHFYGLCNEYTYRYGKKHKTMEKLESVVDWAPTNLENKGQTPILLAMPEEYHNPDPVKAYRDYYTSKQETIKMTWKKREQPLWFELH